MKRSLFATSLLLSTVWMIFPAHAQVDQGNVAVMSRTHADYDPKGIPAGAFRLYPSLTLAAEWNDNVFAQENNKTSDIVFSVRPYISAQSNWGRHSLQASLGAVTTSHREASNDDVTDWDAAADARLDLFHDTTFGFGGFYQDLHESRTAAESGPLTPTSELTEYTVANGHLTASTVLSRFRISGRVDETKYDFKNNGAEFRSHKETAGSVRVDYALSPDTRLVGQVGANKRSYDVDPTRDSKGSDALVGVNTKLTHVINGEVLVGYTEQKYDDPAAGKVSGLAVRGRVEWLPTQLTTVTFTGSREILDTGVAGANGVLSTREGVRVDHELLRNVILTAGVAVTQADYQGAINRSDDWVDADIGATYLMNRNVGITAAYYYGDYSSDGADAGRNYNVNRFMVSVKLRM